MIACENCDGVFQDTPGYERCPCQLYRPHHAMCCTFNGAILLSDADFDSLNDLGISGQIVHGGS